MRNLLRVLKWLVISAFVLALGLVGYVIISFLVLGPLCVKYGIGWDAAFHKWHLAMEAGDPSDAKRWAGRMIGYSNPKIPRHATEAHQCLAGAFELAGDYERSLELYDQYPGNSFSTFSAPLASGRVYYKMDRKSDAFRAYCDFAMRQVRYHSKGNPAVPRRSILGDCYAYEKALCPFLTYPDFLKFMRSEWKKTGNDEEFREAMEYLEMLASPTREPRKK